jgi:p-methyltransferase
VGLDAILIADTGTDTFSGSSPLRLEIDGREALVQVVANCLENDGHIVPPIKGDKEMSWKSAPKFNGIFLLNYLINKKFDVKWINSFLEEKGTLARYLEEKPRALILSTTFIMSKKALRELAEELRRLAPDVPIIVGGPFVYASYQLLNRSHERDYDTDSAKDDFLFLDIDREPPVDIYVVSRCGEQILCEVLRRTREGRTLADIPNTATFDGTTYSFSDRADDVSNPLELGIDWGSLPDTLFQSGVVTMQASNGCPYKCAFCNFVKDRRLTFVKPIEQIITEMKAVESRGARYVRFVDDNFRLGSDDLNEVSQRLVEEAVPLRWMSFVRASTLKHVDFGLLRQAGCTEVQLGLESADVQVLRNMNKRADPDLYGEVIRKTLAAGINCSSCFILGFPGETEETVRRTIEFIKGLESEDQEGVFSWSIYPFILAPLSPIYEFESRKRYGLTGYMQKWRHDTMDSEQAMEHVIKAFSELENSGPIYSGDNIEMLLALRPEQRKEFAKCRHRLSKLAMQGPLDRQNLIESFTEVFAG